MLDTDTKRRIDTARDILVGKVPDPKSQVEQITIALIYKFMDDMDADSEELGGKRKFFTKDFARYGWAKLMRSGLGGHELLGLYAEGITKMPENPGIPLLFRDIFKNAYLPYRDPETLKSFLKIIDEFSYDHSERLGDAFEYLLSVLGSQGDAGQFRTPRHIIDFIVEIIAPKKGETILDPACGTAGFLISSYKHILRTNSDKKGQVTLTPDEKGRVAKNIKGYDISPDMVRLSLVNLYLHGFTDPHIYEYDTLTSEERWNEFADVILANPPFMSPKGGIKPHKRFSIQAKRSEVLFVDYIAEHLTPNGRAGIIVPEGIIFQSQTAYKGLRKMLVENSLVAVISLPAGVFNPYSGVKTSILILDKSLAKQSNAIAFFKIENDGFGLGAQRRANAGEELTQVKVELAEYLQTIRSRQPIAGFKLTLGLIVAKEKIAENDDLNLSGERYRENSAVNTKFPLLSIREIALEIKAGFASGESSKDTVGVPHIRPMNITDKGQFTWDGTKFISNKEFNGREEFVLKENDVLFNNTNSKELVGKTCLIKEKIQGGFSNHMTRIRVNSDCCIPKFLALLLHSAWKNGEFLRLASKWIGQAGINSKLLSEVKIPLPPLDVQKEIVAEIEGYQKVIDGARSVLDNYRPHIPINPDWPMGILSDVCTLISGQHIDKADYNTDRVGVDYLTGPSDFGLKHPVATRWTSNPKVFAEKGDILMTVKGSGLGSVNMLGPARAAISRQLMAIRVRNADPEFIFAIVMAKYEHIQSLGGGAAIPGITREDVLGLEIPLPPFETQQQIVAEIEAEQALVAANRELIARFEKKIQSTLARVWGEGEKIG